MRHVADVDMPQLGSRVHLYECRKTGGEIIKQGAETLDVAWFPVDALPPRCVPNTALYLQLTLDNHPHPVQKTVTYSRWYVMLRRTALALRNLRNRFLRG